VFVVASARDDFDPAAVLFEFNGVRRDTAPSREARQETSTGPASGLDVSHTGTLTAGFGKLGAPEIDAYTAIPVISPCLETQAGGLRQPCTQAYVAQPVVVHGTQDPCVSDIAFAQGRNNGGENVLMQPIAIQDVRPIEKAQNGRGWNDDGTAYTVDTHATQGVAHPMSITFGMDGDFMGDVAGTITTREGSISDTAHTVMQPLGFSGRGDGSDALEGITPTMRSLAQGADGHQSGSAGLAVMQPIAFQQTAGCLTAAYGTKWNGNASATNGSLFAAQPMVLMDQGGSVMNVEHDMVGTLRRETHGHEPVVMQPIPFDTTQITSPANYSKPQAGDPCHPLAAGAHAPAVAQPMAVRRLTPVECERLQGFPDGYTNIPWRKKDESPDGPRYKALGNSWAVPVVAWIGKRINEAVK
jgi:DNA (cytosine-5)-methyltransferase 1